MFERLRLSGQARLEVLEEDSDGRWVGGADWIMRYPSHRLSINEMMAKKGIYHRDADSGSINFYCTTEHTVADLLPHVKDRGVELTRTCFYEFPLTVDVRSGYYRSSVRKCYIMKVAKPLIDSIEIDILVRKMYYNRIMSIYPSARVYGSNMKKPIVFGEYLTREDTWMAVALIMPVDPRDGIQKSLYPY